MQRPDTDSDLENRKSLCILTDNKCNENPHPSTNIADADVETSYMADPNLQITVTTYKRREDLKSGIPSMILQILKW